MTTKHTPWFVIDHPNGWTIQDREHGGGSCIAQHYGDAKLGRKYADQIVRCVNSHDTLVAAVEGLIALGCPDCLDDKCAGGARVKCPLAAARAAVAQAQP